MNDDPSPEVFAAELRRELLPAAPSARLTRAVAAGLSRPASASLATRLRARWLERRVGVRLAWVGAAAMFLTAAAIGAFRPASPTRNSTAPLVAVAPPHPEPDPGPALVAMEPAPASGTLSAGRGEQPFILRSRREYVDTLRWRDRRTGARLEVRYPRAEFVLASAEPF